MKYTPVCRVLVYGFALSIPWTKSTGLIGSLLFYNYAGLESYWGSRRFASSLALLSLTLISKSWIGVYSGLWLLYWIHGPCVKLPLGIHVDSGLVLLLAILGLMSRDRWNLIPALAGCITALLIHYTSLKNWRLPGILSPLFKVHVKDSNPPSTPPPNPNARRAPTSNARSTSNARNANAPIAVNQEDLQTLQGMGFTAETALRALQVCPDVQSAALYCLNPE